MLSPMDAVMAPFGLHLLYVYPAPTASSFDLERLQTSFYSLIEEDYPVFLGRLYKDDVTGAVGVEPTPDSQSLGAKSISFVVDTDSKVTTNEAIDSASLTLLPSARNKESGELLRVKCSRLADGGLALGFDMPHCMLDGEGMFTFVKTWARHYRGAPRSPSDAICHDRHLLNPRGAKPALEHPEFLVPPVSVAAPVLTTLEAPPPASLPPKTAMKPFHLAPEQLRELKALVCDENAYASTVDAVTALFTLLITQARGHTEDVKITTGVNGRRRFDPPLPHNYAGNVIFNALSTYSATELQKSSRDSLRMIARRIRASIQQRDESFMRDAIEFIASQSPVKWSDIRVGTNFFFGPDLMFTSWVNHGMYDAEFEATKPWYVGPPRLPLCDGLSIIMEAQRGDTGLDVVVLLEEKALQRLEKLWPTCLSQLR
ncbi:hypothetical protein P43SY_000138 [Pythium insidiosum]|uniref:Transferase n=1 Tax=Pythium insidiosum TaxID=114742 RepID=A0AAD5M9C9_PYTIN|nr:hypothetical protein P43SY_000138 [Pythium insidiosum]